MATQQLFPTLSHRGLFANVIAGQMPIVALIFLCYGLLRLSLHHSELFTGVDLFWHLAYGNYIIANGELPAVDWLT